MTYFNTYVSNTTAAGGSQYHFSVKRDRTCRVYYKIFAGGTYDYSLLFTNIMDSTFADGGKSHANQLGGEWQIKAASIGLVKDCSEAWAADPGEVYPLTFGGTAEKTVMPGEYFTTDPVSLTAAEGEFLCIEMTVTGEDIPCHYESVLPAFVKKSDGWTRDTMVPFPAHVGCTRPVKARLGFLGDSITQGCGTAVNSYTHWGAYLGEMLGRDYSFWNLGLGYGRAMDGASDGTWLYKAKHLDGITLCFGVNDILRGRTAAQMKEDLTTILRKLREAGVGVLLQTVPPFDYTGEAVDTWNEVNTYLREVLSKEADAFFDCVPTLSDSGAPEDPHATKYGGHPNAAGGLAWAKALFPVMAEFAARTAEKKN